MYKTIYNEYNMLNEEGRELDAIITKSIISTFSKCLDLGFNPRDIGHLFMQLSQLEESERSLIISIKK